MDEGCAYTIKCVCSTLCSIADYFSTKTVQQLTVEFASLAKTLHCCLVIDPFTALIKLVISNTVISQYEITVVYQNSTAQLNV